MVDTGCHVVSQERGGEEGKDWNGRTLSLGKDLNVAFYFSQHYSKN